jgi:nicotinamidase/pyrazinamidase
VARPPRARKNRQESDVSVSEETTAELLAVIASGRPEPFVDVGLAGSGSDVTRTLRDLREAFASLALAEAPRNPTPGLRARIARSLENRATPPRRALLVIDMQNDHLTPGRPLEVPRARAIVPAMTARLEAARRDRVPVVYVVDQHDPSDADLDAWGTHNVKGTAGAEIWPPLAPQPGDRIVGKPTYSAFSRSNLADVLSELRVDTLVLAGCLTEIGLLATATDALQRGFAVEVPPETQAGATEITEQMALNILRLLPPYGPARQALLTAVSA